MKSVALPPAALRDENSVEMLRVWIAEEALHCSLRIGMYAERGMDEPRAWGVILADAAQHISDALASEELGAREDILHAIQGSFETELAKPTSSRDGEFVARPS
jgi:hypothetical protein